MAPGQVVAVVGPKADGTRRGLALPRWGLVPRWAADPAAGPRPINARAGAPAGTAGPTTRRPALTGYRLAGRGYGATCGGSGGRRARAITSCTSPQKASHSAASSAGISTRPGPGRRPAYAGSVSKPFIASAVSSFLGQRVPAARPR
ncbi:MAG: SOS response-associated peptidase [Gemmataceae bacterium]|nr:SOS response-associated peptidase [Gemmataceae bacterium]